MTLNDPLWTKNSGKGIEVFPDDESRRLFMRGLIGSLTIFMGGCAHRVLDNTKPSKEQTLEMLLSHEIILSGKSKPMPRNIVLEPLDKSGNYKLIIPELDLITEDQIIINEHGHILTETVKIRLKPFEFRAKVAASIYGFTEGDTYTIKNGTKQIIIEKK